jgi:hypothetical protein
MFFRWLRTSILLTDKSPTNPPRNTDTNAPSDRRA